MLLRVRSLRRLKTDVSKDSRSLTYFPGAHYDADRATIPGKIDDFKTFSISARGARLDTRLPGYSAAGILQNGAAARSSCE